MNVIVPLIPGILEGVLDIINRVQTNSTTSPITNNADFLAGMYHTALNEITALIKKNSQTFTPQNNQQGN